MIEKSKWILLIELLKDPDRKSIIRIIRELVILSITFREIPTHYFTRYLYKKRINNIRDYLPNKLLATIPSMFNDNKEKAVLDNKLFFDLFYRQFDVNLPKLLMYNIKNLFFIENKIVEINHYQDFADLLEDIFKKNLSFSSVFIKKTCSSSSGKNIYKLFDYQIREEPEIVSKVFTEVIKSGFLFQETIRQHSDLNKLNSSCLNSIRLDTFTDDEGNTEIISGYIRMSIRSHHVDNTAAGGCFVGIDLKTGKLKKYGYSLTKFLGVKELTEHPLTNIVFEDFSIPFFMECKDLILTIAKINRSLRLVGWDVGIGESGPVIIEGNSDYAISGNDLVDGGYLANLVFRKVLHEIKYL
jgi:hypothetical protein